MFKLGLNVIAAILVATGFTAWVNPSQGDGFTALFTLTGLSVLLVIAIGRALWQLARRRRGG